MPRICVYFYLKAFRCFPSIAVTLGGFPTPVAEHALPRTFSGVIRELILDYSDCCSR